MERRPLLRAVPGAAMIRTDTPACRVRIVSQTLVAGYGAGVKLAIERSGSQYARIEATRPSSSTT